MSSSEGRATTSIFKVVRATIPSPAIRATIPSPAIVAMISSTAVPITIISSVGSGMMS
ncbi:unknown protein [Microcystis aeruginosa NIES-843]|uniref:Uncharacterized protein n=1 Tax=Microcystis aeruginosa (strain NIES-843 / IAM M-2473) TaxID=449447 RepID=B0JWV5_MICAN|nr:unknown protein [Microcystis aeruginosa NIES-843]